MFLFLIVLFIYSIETENFYITKFSKNTILDNIVYETCIVGKNSNGTQINNRFKMFANNVSDYCNESGNYCDLIIINNTAIPPLGNWSLLNYTHYDYHIDYKWRGLNTSLDFVC